MINYEKNYNSIFFSILIRKNPLDKEVITMAAFSYPNEIEK